MHASASSTCSLARQAAAAQRRSSGPRARSNGRRASSPASRAASRSARGVRQRRQVDHRQGRRPRPAAIDLHRLAAPSTAEARAQRLVPAHDLAEGRRRAPRRPARPASAQRHRHVVGRAARLEAGRGTRAAAARTRAAAAPSPRHRARAAARPAPRSRAARRSIHRPASSATVGASNSARSGSSTPNGARTRDTTCVASSEWPPSSKKLVLAPRPAPTPSTSAQIPASSSSVGVRGATYAPRLRQRAAPAPAAPCGPPCRWRSAAARPATTNADGTMYSGSAAPQVARAAPSATPAASAATTYATRPRSPGASSRASTAASRTAGCAAQRRLDLAQLDAEAAHLHLVVEPAQELERGRPAAQRARSPVRYSRRPGARRTDRARSARAVSSGGPGSRAPPRAAHAAARRGTPTGTGSSSPVRAACSRDVGDRPADRRQRRPARGSPAQRRPHHVGLRSGRRG